MSLCSRTEVVSELSTESCGLLTVLNVPRWGMWLSQLQVAIQCQCISLRYLGIWEHDPLRLLVLSFQQVWFNPGKPWVGSTRKVQVQVLQWYHGGRAPGSTNTIQIHLLHREKESLACPIISKHCSWGLCRNPVLSAFKAANKCVYLLLVFECIFIHSLGWILRISHSVNAQKLSKSKEEQFWSARRKKTTF